MSEAMKTLREDVRTALTRAEPMVSSWVLVYETQEIDQDGDVAGAGGTVMSGSQATTLGLLELAAHHIRVDSIERD